MPMPTILHLADSKRLGCGASVRFENGEPCTVSIAQSGVIVKKSEGGLFGLLFGPKLFAEKNAYTVSRCALALTYLFPERRFPDGISSLPLRAFLNAILHCSSPAEVAVTLNQAVWNAEKRLGRSLEEISVSNLPSWATQEPMDAFLKRYEEPKRPFVGTYQLIYSNGAAQERRFIPAEIDSWVTQSNEDAADKPYRIVRVLDSNGNIVWGS
jgi:hypothetical protein